MQFWWGQAGLSIAMIGPARPVKIGARKIKKQYHIFSNKIEQLDHYVVN